MCECLQEKSRGTATELLNLTSRLEITILYYFIEYLHDAFWKHPHDVLKLKDGVSRQFGCTNRKMATEELIAHQDIQVLKYDIETNPYFQ